MSLTDQMIELAKQAKSASRDLARLATADKNACLVAMADAESAQALPGAGALTDLLCGLLLVQVLRAQLAVDSRTAAPWIHGLEDARVGTALGLIHESPQEDWTVARLASAVAMSRSNFAQRFTLCVGESPMRYLARWRIQLAAHQLRTSDTSLVRIAEHVGYESEAAFNRAFKRHFGVPPAAWRKKAST